MYSHALTLTLTLDIPVILPPDDELVLDNYLGSGLQPGETVFPEDSEGILILTF